MRGIACSQRQFRYSQVWIALTTRTLSSLLRALFAGLCSCLFTLITLKHSNRIMNTNTNGNRRAPKHALLQTFTLANTPSHQLSCTTLSTLHLHFQNTLLFEPYSHFHLHSSQESVHLSLPHSHIHTHTHTHTLPQTHTPTNTRTHTLSLSLNHTCDVPFASETPRAATHHSG
jgi:hypothetical protein